MGAIPISTHLTSGLRLVLLDFSPTIVNVLCVDLWAFQAL